MPRYAVDSKTSRLVVTARSSIHDTKTIWSRITGDIETSLAGLESGESPRAILKVDMSAYDAGSWLKNRHLKKEFGLDKVEYAQFSLDSLTDVTVDADRISAQGGGALSWRGESVELAITGEGTVTDARLQVRCQFELNVRDLGLTPPSFLMFKVEDQVTVSVELVATA